MAVLRLVYKGSRSMRGTVLGALCAFWAEAAEGAFGLLMTREVEGCDMESWRLNAAGSMSGIVGGRYPSGMRLAVL